MSTGNKNTIETQGRIFMGNNKSGLLLPTNPLSDMSTSIKHEKDLEEAGKMYRELAKQKQKELDAKMKTLEIIPMGNKVMMLPYPENPYKKIASTSGIIVDYNGEFNNPDTGEKDKLQTFVGCAKVIEMGPECKYVIAGDDVFYDTRTVYPVPFLNLGYILTTEPQFLLIINGGLKKRFKMK